SRPGIGHGRSAMREPSFWQRLAGGATAMAGPLGGLIAAEDGVVHYFADGVTKQAVTGLSGQAASPPIVLLHGASGNLRDLTLSLLPVLAQRHRVIALDRPGFGHSSLVAGAQHLSVQARVLRRALRRLGHRRYHLVGHSYGGALALDWALHHPREVLSLSLVSAVSMDWGGSLAPLYRIGRVPGLFQLASQLATWAPDRLVSDTLAAVFAPAPVPAGYRDAAAVDLALRPATFRLNQRQVNALHPQILALMPRHCTLACPVTVIHGSEDEVVPATIHAAPLARRLSRATLDLIESAGHMPHHTHTAVVADAIHRTVCQAIRTDA
ncbi:MAG: alpha/beta hydrolase, partial [Pseudomonadota bacterium]